MTKLEAMKISQALGIEPCGPTALADKLDDMGYQLAMCNTTGDWVVLDAAGTELVRCA